MDRREWLGLVGAGAGASLGGSALQAGDHGPATTDNRSLMAPVHELHAHFCGIHIAKNNPNFHIIVQH